MSMLCQIGNLGNLVLIIVPAVCDEDGSPFSNNKVCSTVGLSYASFSMAVRQYVFLHHYFSQTGPVLILPPMSLHSDLLLLYLQNLFWVFFFQLGSFYIWTYTYQQMKSSSLKFKELQAEQEVAKTPNKDLDADGQTHLLNGEDEERADVTVSLTKYVEDPENQAVTTLFHITALHCEIVKSHYKKFCRIHTNITLHPLTITDCRPRTS